MIFHKVKTSVKNKLKKILGFENYRKLYILIKKITTSYYMIVNRMGKVFFKNAFWSHNFFYQKPLSWETEVPDFDNLVEFLRARGLCFENGGNAIYIPPQKNLYFLGDFINFYPSNAGFKIVKDINSPYKANYLRKNTTTSLVERVITGNLFSQFLSACVTEIFDIGVKVYDLIEIREKGSSRSASCYVVQHVVKGDTVTKNDYKEFINRLSTLESQDLIKIAVPFQNNPHIDFSEPDCNGNLLKTQEGKLYYVDFQQFVVTNREKILKTIIMDSPSVLSFGDVHPLRKHKYYLYQSIPGIKIPGKRDTEKRWAYISKLLNTGGINIKNRLVLDICCNSGIILSCALSNGALWGIGWDLPEVVVTAEKIQKALGFSRLTFVPAILSANYPLKSTIPQNLSQYLTDSVVFYLAAWNHIGFVSDLANIPWKALVFEGHEEVYDYAETIAYIENSCNAKLFQQIKIADGDSRPRIMLLFVR